MAVPEGLLGTCFGHVPRPRLSPRIARFARAQNCLSAILSNKGLSTSPTKPFKKGPQGALFKWRCRRAPRYPPGSAEEARYQLADLRYRNGAASYLDVLDAQRAFFTAQQALVQTQALQMQSLVTLYKVLGGGWSDASAR